MVSKEMMYMVVDTHMNMIYAIVDRLEDAIVLCGDCNRTEDRRYHEYEVRECTRQYGEMWLQAWRDLL